MTRPSTPRRRPSFALPLPHLRLSLTLLALALAVLAFAALALLGPGVPRSDAAVFMSQVPGAHWSANSAARVELNRVASRLRLRKPDGAIEAMEAAIKADSLSAEVWAEAGQLRLRVGDFRGAYEAYNRSAVLAPERSGTWARLGQVSFMHLGLEEQGSTAIQYALATDSLNATAWYTRALYHWTRAELPLAQQAIARARDYESDKERSLIWFSTEIAIGLSRGEYAKAVHGLATHLATAPNDLAGRQHYAHALRGTNDLRMSREQLTVLLAAAPQSAWMVELGLVFRAEGMRDSALRYFERAARADTAAFDAGYNLALERAALGDTAGAWRELRRLRRLDDENFLLPLFASRLARADGDTMRARLAFEEARRLNPALGLATSAELGTSPPIPAWASPDLAEGERLIERGEFTLAADRFTMAAQDPARRGAGLFWSSRVGRMTGAARGFPVIAAQAAAEAMHGDPVLVRALAEAQWAAGDAPRAIHNLQGLRRVSPDDLVAAALLSEALLSVGEKTAARSVWNDVATAPTRSWAVETARADAFTAVNDAGAAIARQRAAAADYLPMTR